MGHSNGTDHLAAYYCNSSRIGTISIAGNFTFVDTSGEASMVSGSVFMFVLAGFFLNLNLFSGLSDVSAILSPRVRLLFSSALSLFLPVMSYLFSEAKNSAMALSSGVDKQPELSFMAGVILTWMLLVELIRKKVDEIAMRGYSGTIHRAGRVAWLGSLIFFNIRSTGRRSLFGILWVLCATKLVQRIAFTEVGKRSYTCGKNARLINSYMYNIQQQQQWRRQGQEEEGQRQDDGDAMLKRCKYIVMGEGGLDIEAAADGYKIKDSSYSLVTVGRIWEELAAPAQNGRIFAGTEGDHRRLGTLCLSFALFKLLRRRFEHLPEMSSAETSECRDLIFKGLYKSELEGTAEAVFQVMKSEVNFLSEYYHSVVPVVLASPFFFFVNYFLQPVVVLCVCLMTIILCGSGDVQYAFGSIKTDNFTISSGIVDTTMCLLLTALKSPSAFYATVNFSVTFLLYVIYLYEEIWEFFVFLLSNWFMVSLLCNYVARPHWRNSRTFRAFIHCILCVRSRMNRHPILCFKQFSAMNLRWPPALSLPAALSSLLLRTKPVSNKVKHSIVDSLASHCRHGYNAPLSNGRSALVAARRDELLWACESDSVAEVILTWHIATALLEPSRPPTMADKHIISNVTVATSLSRYCAYLVAFHPELLPDYQEKSESAFGAMKEELMSKLGFYHYYLSPWRARVDTIMRAAKAEDDWKGKGVVHNGAKLAHCLLKYTAGAADHRLETTMWKLLADVWTELIIYVAPSSDDEHLMGHENVLGQGGEFITMVWALTTHTGIARPPTKSTSSSDNNPQGQEEIAHCV